MGTQYTVHSCEWEIGVVYRVVLRQNISSRLVKIYSRLKVGIAKTIGGRLIANFAYEVGNFAK